MKKELKPIADAMTTILQDGRSSRIERIEASKILLSLAGMLIPDVNESFLTVRQITQLRAMKERIVEKVLRRKAVRKKANRRAYLRRQIRALEAQQPAKEESNEQNS